MSLIADRRSISTVVNTKGTEDGGLGMEDGTSKNTEDGGWKIEDGMGSDRGSNVARLVERK